jgi:predicted RNase H-like HicB family nuclease
MKSLSNVSEPEKFYIEMKEINFNGRVLQSRDKLRFEPFYDSDIHMMAIRDPEFRMFVSGNTKEELQKEIEEVIAFLWEEYALEEDKNLTKGAIDLKNKLLDTFKEESQN